MVLEVELRTLRNVPPSGGSLEIGNPQDYTYADIKKLVMFPLRGDP